MCQKLGFSNRMVNRVYHIPRCLWGRKSTICKLHIPLNLQDLQFCSLTSWSVWHSDLKHITSYGKHFPHCFTNKLKCEDQSLRASMRLVSKPIHQSLKSVWHELPHTFRFGTFCIQEAFCDKFKMVSVQRERFAIFDYQFLQYISWDCCSPLRFRCIEIKFSSAVE